MRRIGALLAVLAAAAVVLLYLRGGDPSRRAAPGSRPAAAAPAGAAPAPEAPSDPTKGERAALLAVRDKAGNAVPGATIGRYQEGKFEGETAATGADGRCRLPLPEPEPESWFEIAIRHPDFVQGQAYVRPAAREYEIVLERGAPLVVIVLDAGRKPLEGATVKASSDRTHGTAGFFRWREGQDFGTSVTDAQGRAPVGAVPEGIVFLSVDREPFALKWEGVEVTGDAPVEHVVVLDAGASLEGRVVGPGGEGVAGAAVRIQGVVRPVATSGAGGEFRLEAVPESAHVTLVAEAPGYGPGFFGAGLGWGDPVPIPVRVGDRIAGLEIALSKPTYVVGRFVDDAGAPVEGIVAQVYVSDGFSLEQQGRSGADGRFRAGPFSMSEAGRAWLWCQSPLHAIEQKEVQVSPGAEADAGTILATRRGILRGVLVEAGGGSVEGFVWAETRSANNMRDSRYIETRPDGTFELKGVGPGDVTLVGSVGKTMKSRRATFAVTAGSVTEGIELVLLPTKPIKGRVITPDGRPRPNALLGIRADGPTILDRVSSEKDGTFSFDGLVEGEYTVGVTGTMGAFWIREEGDDFLPQPAPVRVSAGREDLEFIVPIKGGIITGKVVAKRDGQPLREFGASFIRYKLFIPSDSDWDSFRSDTGEFRYETDQPGTWQVDVSADGLASHRTDRFNLAAGEVKDLGTIRLGPGGTIAGRVLDAQQQPVPHARINILNEKLQTNADEPFTDFEGRFEVKGVSPGLFTVFAVSPRHPLGIVRGVEVREGERTEVQIAFVEPAPLTIDVRDSSGQPVEGARLVFTFPAVAPLTSSHFQAKIPPGYGSLRSDATGTIRQLCLPPGEVTITIEQKEFEPVSRKLDLKPGEPNRVEIRLRRPGG